jgi:glucuronate isomerase
MTKLLLSPDRGFSPDPATRKAARVLYESVAGLPLVCPHGHVDPRLFVDPGASFGSPADLLIIPDHYVTRMLHSQGIPLEDLGVPPSPPSPSRSTPVGLPLGEGRRGEGVETDHRKIWRLFCANFHLFRGTPSGLWLADELASVFGVDELPAAGNADRLYDALAEKLASPEFRPRRLFERFNIEVLSTTDAAADELGAHQALRASGWKGRIVPCFRPDGVVNLDAPGWKENIAALGRVCGKEIRGYRAFIAALEERRKFFKSLGATASDHAVLTPFTEELSQAEAEAIFARALRGEPTKQDALRFTGHMLIENARMSLDDGLVMQIHAGAFRNHNAKVYERFGPDKGADIPVQVEFTRNLRPLLNKYGDDARLTLVLFTLDETTYSRELAPLAGHYPAVRIGPPWWFFDSLNGMRRYFDSIVETAGLYNTAGFNDDTRAFPSIPARHDLWRRAAANWIAGLVVQGQVTMEDGREMILDAAVRLAKKTYKFE